MKRKLVALLLLSYRCGVTINVLWLFLTVPWMGWSTVCDCDITFRATSKPQTHGTAYLAHQGHIGDVMTWYIYAWQGIS